MTQPTPKDVPTLRAVKLEEALKRLVNMHDNALFVCGVDDQRQVDHALIQARAALAQPSAGDEPKRDLSHIKHRI